MSVLKILMILFAGTVAGFINTLAGGGSLIAMSTLIFMGLPSAIANGTNRIAVLIQNIVAVTNFRRKGFFNFKFSFKLSIPAMIGAIIGSNLAVDLPEDIFNKILAGVMILVLILIIFDPKKKIETTIEKLSSSRQLAAMVAFFFVGIYGGFIQGGVGFLFIVTLSLITGLSLVKINSIKVFVIAAYTIPSLIVFIINGKVAWLLGLILAIGNSIGAYLGSNFAVSKGDKWIRGILVVIILIMAVKLFIGS
ncbi:sulfite exporter TauE/SafE family protein [Sporohalobacter salinus]|uniref:sulfite exporter TauE/SafE family protein n=1 Tax=Sporohalobacter salinus TaxID=1494606 RepID=UPI001961CACC|nr:sulfite exporter TauE/SafE family protein [Sporohalobacter salinus]MBM7624461.1 putative membrane protein YfcA [Sporohalobacter salinus]